MPAGSKANLGGLCLQEINTTIKIQLKVKGELKKLKLTTMTRDYR